MSHTFKILSLDGGGIRGLYTATVLSHFEEAFGKPIGHYFDMICGTSTGGLIALALSRGVPAAKIAEFYKSHGPGIFPVKKRLNKIRNLYNQILSKGKYDNAYLANALTEVLGDTQMSEAGNLLCIPAYNLTTGKPRVFKFPHLEGNNYSSKYGSMLDVALATSAAPTYFPVKFIDGCYYTDGGVWANNPVLCGIRDALEYFVGDEKTLLAQNAGVKFDNYSILSLACLPEKNGWVHTGKSDDLSMSAADWNMKLIGVPLDGQSFFSEDFASRIIHMTRASGSYLRIDGSDRVSSAQKVNLSLDNVSPASLQALVQIGNAVGDHYRTRDMKLIRPFFLEKKKYQTK